MPDNERRPWRRDIGTHLPEIRGGEIRGGWIDIPEVQVPRGGIRFDNQGNHTITVPTGQWTTAWNLTPEPEEGTVAYQNLRLARERIADLKQMLAADYDIPMELLR